MLYSLKNFLVTFLIAALIFGVAAYFVSGFLMKTVADPLGVDEDKLNELLNPSNGTTASGESAGEAETEPPLGDETTEEVPFDTGVETDENGEAVSEETTETDSRLDTSAITGDSFTMLFILTDYQPDKYDDYAATLKSKTDFEYGALSGSIRYTEAETLLLMRVDKENGRFIFLPIPVNSRVLVGTQYFSLKTLWSNCGRDWMVSKINAMTGMTIDRYMVVNITDMPDILDSIGDVTYTVPYDIYDVDGEYSSTPAADSDGAAILAAGKQAVESSAIVPLLLFEDYPKGTAERLSFDAGFFKQLVSIVTEPDKKSGASDFYNSIKNNLDTDFTIADLAKNIDLIFSYEQFTTETLTYPGSYAKDADGNQTFVPDTGGAVEMLADYK